MYTEVQWLTSRTVGELYIIRETKSSFGELYIIRGTW